MTETWAGETLTWTLSWMMERAESWAGISRGGESAHWRSTSCSCPTWGHRGDWHYIVIATITTHEESDDHYQCLDQSDDISHNHLGAGHGEHWVITAGAEAAQAPGVEAGVENMQLRWRGGEGEHLSTEVSCWNNLTLIQDDADLNDTL